MRRISIANEKWLLSKLKIHLRQCSLHEHCPIKGILWSFLESTLKIPLHSPMRCERGHSSKFSPHVWYLREPFLDKTWCKKVVNKQSCEEESRKQIQFNQDIVIKQINRRTDPVPARKLNGCWPGSLVLQNLAPP